MSVIGLITLGVSVLSAVAALVLPAGRAAAIYLVVLIVWPVGVLIQPFGTIQIEPMKFIIPFLLLNLILKERRLEGFRPHALDLAILVMVIAEAFAGAVNIPADDLLEHQGNALTRTIFAYVALRLAVQSRSELFVVLRWVVYAAGFVAGVCVYESVTGFSLYDWFVMTVGGYEWRMPWPPRFGFNRAVGSFNNPLPMGLLFSFLVPMALILRDDPRWKPWKTVVFVPLLLGGLLSTMSSGPIFAMAATVAVIACYPFRILAPAAGAIALTVAVFWVLLAPQTGVSTVADTVSAGAYDAVNASYRARLVEEAFTGGMDGHWVFGYGRVGLGAEDPDSPEFNWAHQDLVNMWILQLVFYGLFGLVALILVNVSAFVRLGRSLYVYRSPRTDFAVWLVLSAFVGWHVAYMAVAPLVSLSTFNYAMIGVIGNMPVIVRDWQEHGTPSVREMVWTGRSTAAAAPA